MDIISFMRGFSYSFTLMMIEFAKNVKNTRQAKTKKHDKVSVFPFPFRRICFIMI